MGDGRELKKVIIYREIEGHKERRL